MNKTDLTCLGNFTVADVKSICGAFGNDNIYFELEMDDSAIRYMNPAQAAYGGTNGDGATANIFIRPEQTEQAQQVINHLKIYSAESEYKIKSPTTIKPR